MSAPADANIHAGRDDVESPNCALATVWCRDAADGRCLVALLHRLSSHRGVAHVKAAVARWLREMR